MDCNTLTNVQQQRSFVVDGDSVSGTLDLRNNPWTESTRENMHSHTLSHVGVIYSNQSTYSSWLETREHAKKQHTDTNLS